MFLESPIITEDLQSSGLHYSTSMATIIFIFLHFPSKSLAVFEHQNMTVWSNKCHFQEIIPGGAGGGQYQ